MQFQFTETQLTTAVGTVIAAIAAVVGRYVWKFMHSTENGEITIGWAAGILSVVCATFGGVNWHLTVPPNPPSISTTDSAEVVKAKMQQFEQRKDLAEKERNIAQVPLIAAVPITFLSLPLLLMSFVKLKVGYADRAQKRENDIELAKLTALETAKVLAQPAKNAESIRATAAEDARGYAPSYGTAPLTPEQIRRLRG